MGVVNLTKPGYQVNTSKDGIVIVRSLDDIRAGKSLDVTGYTPKFIAAGHVIIMETATKNYKPMPVNGEPYAAGNSYAALPAGHEYAGILKATIPSDEAFAGILTVGTVREEAMPYPLAAIKAAFKVARPLIDYAQ